MPIFGKRKSQQVDIDSDLKAVNNFLGEVNKDISQAKRILHELKKMREEAQQLTDEEALKKNMHEQIELYDNLLERYSYIDQDAAINAVRLKNVAYVYISEAKKHKFYNLLEKINSESRWL